MNCIIVDDDEMSRNMMKQLVSQVHFLNLVATCSSATAALNILNNNPIDLILLDIEMPDMNGIELVNSLDKPPLTILATSKKEYALKAFESNVIDYLLKPVLLNRFVKAINKAKVLHEKSLPAIQVSNSNYVFIKNNGTLEKMNINEILWIEALGDYMTIHTLDKKHIVHSTMKEIEKKLPADVFIRIHRSYIISIDKITAIDDNIVIIGKQLIPVGAVYKENLTKHLNLL